MSQTALQHALRRRLRDTEESDRQTRTDVPTPRIPGGPSVVTMKPISSGNRNNTL